MKLSLERAWGPGAIWVRGGRILDVAHDHQVPTNTLSYADHAQGFEGVAKHGDAKWMTAVAGNLAIEIVAAKTDKVLGHAYLTGPAVQLHRYHDQPCPAHWFKEVVGWLLSGQMPEASDPQEEKARIDGLLRGKFSPARLAAFEFVLGTEQSVDNCMQWLEKVMRLIPNHISDEDAAKAVCNVIGSVRTKNKKKRAGTLHVQPKFEAADVGCAPFHIGLVLSSPHLIAVDVFAEPFTAPMQKENVA